MFTFPSIILSWWSSLGGAQPVIPPNLAIRPNLIPPNLYVYEHYSLGSPGKVILPVTMVILPVTLVILSVCCCRYGYRALYQGYHYLTIKDTQFLWGWSTARLFQLIIFQMKGSFFHTVGLVEWLPGDPRLYRDSPIRRNDRLSAVQ